jgi:hypothetical protein
MSITFIIRNIFAVVSFDRLNGRFTIGPRPGFAAGEPGAFASSIYDVTAEFVLWLMLFAANVQARGDEGVN